MVPNTVHAERWFELYIVIPYALYFFGQGVNHNLVFLSAILLLSATRKQVRVNPSNNNDVPRQRRESRPSNSSRKGVLRQDEVQCPDGLVSRVRV